jgi:exosortase/archaeosortase family protein
MMKNWKKIKPFLFFALKFCFFSIVFYWIYLNTLFNTSPLEKLNVLLLKKVFYGNLSQIPSYYHKESAWALVVEKSNKKFYFIIDRDCLGVNIYFALLVFLFSYPFFSLRKKILWAFIYFSLVLFILNPLRLLSLYFLFLNNFKLYLIGHNLIWQITNFLLVVLLILLPLKTKTK